MTNDLAIRIITGDVLGTSEQTQEAITMAVKALSMPSAQPKTGHWIMTHDYFTGAYESIDYVKCSCCGEDSLEMGDYCPNCGAKMVDPQESEE